MNFREFEEILSEAKKRRVAPIKRKEPKVTMDDLLVKISKDTKEKPEGMDDIAWEKLKNFKYR